MDGPAQATDSTNKDWSRTSNEQVEGFVFPIKEVTSFNVTGTKKANVSEPWG